MAPTPQEPVIEKEVPQHIPRPLTGDEVVISGISGIFPKSNSVLEFMDNLYNKVDMVTDENPRWIFNHPEVPKYLGKVDGMGKFDAQFFRVHYKQACTMEPMSRKLLEHAYSAIFDSGINPLQLRGKKVGVFIGSAFSESEKTVIYQNIQRNGFGITGCNKSMYANRISYWMDGKGPSYTLDVACASSMACLEHAYRAISTGQCEAAIVGGCNLCMHPNVSLNMKRAGFLCLDGKTKCFDKNGDGYVRSDAINVMFLQKAKDANRIYCEVYHAKGNYSKVVDGQFLPIREPKEIEQFLESFYSEIDVSPKDVEYVEAHGSGIAEADSNELKAIGKVFAKETPIKIGSVKSNMGHSEPASGVCAVTKVCLAYHKGQLPANLHYHEPLNNIAAVRDGNIDILTDNAPFNRGLTALNSFSYGGANIHVLLKGHYKPKDLDRYKTNIPYIVLASGRQDSCVKNILDIMKSKPIDPEQIGLLHNIHASDIPGHTCRGYTILETNDLKETVSVAQSFEFSSGITRPIWFVYSGMGSQWAGMGTDLMRIPIFAAAIEKCHRVLQPKGIDILKILTDPDKKTYDNILHSFVGIAAVQIGLTDILKQMGIVADNFIGHSVGELGCAYADGCFTAEEMILSAYSRGLVSVQTPFIKGSMAAVGIGYKAIQSLCPPEIEVACHNSTESSTISGPADVMKKFVEELGARGIFAKEVPCSNIAYHSKYIADAGPGLLKLLSEVIKDPKPRSRKWLSTSVPQDQWNEPKAKYSSAEYHTNNLLNSVLFEETAKHIPANALVIEIAPHGLLQAILKRSLSECIHIPLTRRGHADPVKFFLEAVGKLYLAGSNPKVNVLYPKIQFPVSTGTPLLSDLVNWEHSEDWPQAIYNTKDRVMTAAREFVMSVHDDDYKYFAGYARDGIYVFPEAALLVLVWETLAMFKGLQYKDMSVTFNDVIFHGEANIMTDVPLRLDIMIHKGNDKFEVSYENVQIVSGYVKTSKSSNDEVVHRKLQDLEKVEYEIQLDTADVYKILKKRGYSYKDVFQSIHSTNSQRNIASIKWSDDWIPFIDSLIQFNALVGDHEGVSTPKLIKRLRIDIEKHKISEFTIIDNTTCYNAQISKIYDTTRCAGIELVGIVYKDLPIAEEEPNALQAREFIPYFLIGNAKLKTALHVSLQIVAENSTSKIIKVTELLSTALPNISNFLKEVIEEIPMNEFVLNSMQEINNSNSTNKWRNIEEPNLIVVDNLLRDEKKMILLFNNLPKNTFILTIEPDSSMINPKYKVYDVITTMPVQKQLFILLKKTEDLTNVNITYMPITADNKFSWAPKLKAELQKTRKLVLVSENQPFCGVLGLVKGLRKMYGNKIGVVIIDDHHMPPFNPENNIFKEQLQKALAINVYKQGKWGGYYNIPCAMSTNLRNMTLTNTVAGDLDSLRWVEAPTSSSTKNVVQVCYASPSFKDAQNAAGISKNTKSFGMDFSGFNERGEKVMGAVSKGAISSTVEADPNLLWPVPEHWTLEDAATVPLPFLQAYYCLTIKSSLLSGYTVFVNGGAGAFGQAIISICLATGCKVFTTVSDEKKKKFLLQMFPDLDENNIGDSQDATFHSMVIDNTKNQLCNIVISCLSGFHRMNAMKCVGMSGIFLDISEFDMKENCDFEMGYLFKERNYISVNFSNIFVPENSTERKKLQMTIAEGIAKGIVRPLSHVVYPPNDVVKAFELLSSSKHIGKVLLRMRDHVTLKQGLPVLPRMTYSANDTYIVICNENELGIELVDRIIKQGGRNIVVNMKSTCINGYLLTKMESWKKQNATVKMSSENLTTENGCINLFKEGKMLGAIRWLFVVQNFNEIGTFESFVDDVAAKFNENAWTVANLDLISRRECRELRHFVLLSHSSESLTNEYAASVSENICQARNDAGLPGLVFRIALLKEFNYNLDNVQRKVQPQSISAAFNALESSMKLGYNNVISFNLRNESYSKFLAKMAKIIGVKCIDELEHSTTIEDLRFNYIHLEETKVAIKRTFGLSYSADKIKNMTIASLKNLTVNVTKQNTNFDSGLGAFYTYIDQDECMATEPLVAMPTRLSNATEKEEEFNPKATYLMLIPGFEGHHQLFVPVCERLKVHAMTFQLGPDFTNNSIQDMALNILKFTKKRFELTSKFYLLGYSFGVNVALELANLFEKEGHVGIVYCLDSSPDALRVHLDAYIGSLTDTQLQNTIIEHMYRLMTGNNSDTLKQGLEKIENWSDKIDTCVSRLRGLVTYSTQYKKSILETAYKRIMMAREYEPDFVLESELVLMKGIPHPKAAPLPEDYNLSKYTKHPVRVFDIESDHAMAPQDCRASNIINKFLEPKLLENFKTKSLCETYLADPVKTF